MDQNSALIEKLKFCSLVKGLFLERLREVEPQRTHRRIPEEREPDHVAQGHVFIDDIGRGVVEAPERADVIEHTAADFVFLRQTNGEFRLKTRHGIVLTAKTIVLGRRQATFARTDAKRFKPAHHLVRQLVTVGNPARSGERVQPAPR